MTPHLISFILSIVKFDSPILMSFGEAAFQLGLTDPVDIETLIRDGEIVEVVVREQRLIVAESLIAYVRRLKRRVKAAG